MLTRRAKDYSSSWDDSISSSIRHRYDILQNMAVSISISISIYLYNKYVNVIQPQEQGVNTE